MGSGATSTVMIMPSATASAAMSMGSSTSSTAMDMSTSSSQMSMYLTTKYLNVPVVFKSLYATNKATCFAIFVILFFTSFAFRGVSFLSSYIEQKIFREGPINHIVTEIEKDFERKEGKLDESSLASTIEDLEIKRLRRHHSNQLSDAKHRSPLAQFLNFTPQSVYQEFIRLLLTFVQVLIGYSLMLAVMTCIIPYLFAVVLGISFGHIFFDRLSYCLGMVPSSIDVFH